MLAATLATGVAAWLGTVMAGAPMALADLPAAVVGLSPLAHVTAVPMVDIDLAASAIMTGVGAAAVGIGVTAFRRRDLREA